MTYITKCLEEMNEGFEQDHGWLIAVEKVDRHAGDKSPSPWMAIRRNARTTKVNNLHFKHCAPEETVHAATAKSTQVAIVAEMLATILEEPTGEWAEKGRTQEGNSSK
ncbi:hypothetical protein CBL_09175 [Carabus blaptoides fortunei]